MHWTFAKNKVKEIEIILARNREKIVYALIPDKWHMIKQMGRSVGNGCEVHLKFGIYTWTSLYLKIDTPFK